MVEVQTELISYIVCKVPAYIRIFDISVIPVPLNIIGLTMVRFTSRTAKLYGLSIYMPSSLFPPSSSQWLHLLQDGEPGQPYCQRRPAAHPGRGEVLRHSGRTLLQHIQGQRSTCDHTLPCLARCRLYIKKLYCFIQFFSVQYNSSSFKFTHGMRSTFTTAMLVWGCGIMKIVLWWLYCSRCWIFVCTCIN